MFSAESRFSRSLSATSPTMGIKQLVLGWPDYCMFTGVLGISLLIGVYFGFCSKQNTTSHYMFGGKDMNYIAVAASILASFLSGITFLGLPTEVYLHGSQYFAISLSALIIGLISACIIMPYFYRLGISSCYDYLEMRFNRSIRNLAATLYIMSLLLYIPIVIYVPSLAFAQLTGFSIHAISPVFNLVCITYTSIGGVKAVVWTDTIQFVFTLAGFVAVLIIGLVSIGSFSEVWRIAEEGNRLQLFNMDPSPFKRDTFWAVSIGMTVTVFSRFAIGQKFVQRILSIKNESEIKKAVFLSAISWGTIQCFCVFLGLLMYAEYHNCDPLKAKLIERSDQTLPYYVMDIAGHVHGLPGLFLAGIVSSALSTMSAALNTLSGTIYDTYIARFIAEGPKKDSKAALAIKILSVIIGFVIIGMIFLVERLGTVFEMSISFSSVMEGTLLGLFSVAMLFPWVGKTGAMAGSWVALVVMSWIVGGSQWHILHNVIDNNLPTSADGCPYPINETLVHQNTNSTVELLSMNADEEPLFIFRISIVYYTLLGSLIVIVVGLITSYFVGETDLSKVNPEHVLPFIRRLLPKDKFYVEVPSNQMNLETISEAKNPKI